jgi:hypothetical protein
VLFGVEGASSPAIWCSRDSSSVTEFSGIELGRSWNGFATKLVARGLRRASSASAGRLGSELAISV